MKSKIIKKMLATMIAASTIITTPGLANASKKASKKNSKQSSNLTPTSQAKKKKSNRNNEPIRSKTRDSKHKKHNATPKDNNSYSHVSSQVRLAMNKKSYTATDKREFARSINLMIENGWVSGKTKKNLYNLIKILDKCSNAPSARKFVVDSLVKLTSGSYIRQYSIREILTMVHSLKNCREDQTLKQNIATALNNLTANYLIAIPVKDSEKENFRKGVMQIIDILYWAADCMEAKVCVAKSFWELACRGLLDEANQEKISEITAALFLASFNPKSEQYVSRAVGELAYRHLLDKSPKETIFTLTDAILKFDREDEESKANVAFPLSNLAFLEQFEKYPKDRASILIDPLINCVTSYNAQKYFANAIVGLFDHELFKSLSKDQLMKITNKLNECGDNDSAKKYVAFAISRMAYYNLFKEFDNAKMSQIAETLFKCAENHEAKKHVAIAISNLEQDNFLKGYPKQEILKITNLLLEFAKDSNKNDSDSAENNKVLTINVKNLNMGSKVLDMDGRNLTIEGNRLNIGEKRLASDSVPKFDMDSSKNDNSWPENDESLTINIRDLTKEIKPLHTGGKGLYIGDKILTMDGKILNICKKGSTVEGQNLTIQDNDTAMNDEDVHMNDDNLPKNYDDLVEDDEDRIDSNHVSTLVFELARKDLLNQYSDEEISYVVDALIERIYTFPGDAPNEAANAIAKLASKGLLDKYCEKNLPKIINVLFNVADDQTESNRQGISKAFGELARRGHLGELDYEQISSIFYLLNGFACKDQSEGVETAVLDAIFELAQEKLLESFRECDIENIFKLLEKCAIDKPSQTRGRVAKIIFELASIDCFKEFFQKNTLKVIELLNLCAQGSCCHEVCDDNGEKHVENDRKFIAKAFNILPDEMFLYECDQKTIFEIIDTLKSCLENENSCAEDVASLLLKFAASGHLEGCSEERLQNVVKMLSFCANHGPSASKDVAAAIKALASQNVFEKYSKAQILKIVEILSLCSQSSDQQAKEEVADAIYELAHAGLFNEYFQVDIQNIQNILSQCANGIGADNYYVRRALDELLKVIQSKKATF